MPEDVPASILIAQLNEVKDAIIRLTDRIDTKFGEHSDRLARLEVQNENQAADIEELRQQQKESTAGRRWFITTVVSIIAALTAIAALVASNWG